ncbi:hypothetical protein BDAP_001030 [Binucleata daphniae]
MYVPKLKKIENKWQKVLYKQQCYGDNYMEFSEKKIECKQKSIADINKFVLSITSTYIFFSLHLVMDCVRSDVMINLVLVVVLLLSYTCINNAHKLKTFVKLSSIIIFWIYLLSPIFLTLTKEVDTDTIYLCFFVLQLAYSIDNVKCDILEDNMQRSINLECKNKNRPKKEIKDARNINERKRAMYKRYGNSMTSLGLEDTYINHRKCNMSIFGYCCTILGSILLCSRYKSVDDVFLHLSLNLAWFILFPYYRCSFRLDENVYFVIMFVFVGVFVTKLCNTALFISCIAFIVAVYMFTFAIMYITNYLTHKSKNI